MLLILDEATGRGPYELVTAAVEAKLRGERDARRGRGDAPDEFWCVADVDEHRRIPEALALAETHGIHVALSNPCFELWLLLHYREQHAWAYNHSIQHDLKAVAGIGKTLSSNQLQDLVGRFEIARARAVALDKEHARNSTSDRNPSSEVWRLVESIRRRRPPSD